MLLEIKIAIVILAGFMAAFTDYKTGYIYDWLNWPFIAVGAILAIFSPDVLWAFLEFAIVFILGFVFYHSGKIGGGDIKFFAGLALYFPFFNGTIFLVVVVILASFIALLFYGVYYFVLLLKEPNSQIYLSFGLSFIMSLIIFILFMVFSYWYLAVGLFIFSFFAFISLLLKETIMEKFYTNKITISNLLDDDLINLDLLKEKHKDLKLKAHGNMYPLDKKMYNKLKKDLPKNTKIIVYRNLPVFGPFIFLGIIFGFIILSFVNFGFFI